MSADFERNRAAWDATSDAYQAEHREQLARSPMAWGIWSLPESELQLIGDVAGRDVLEYGCGGAQWSIALARLGARVTGLDNSARQLAHARSAVDASGLPVTLVHGNGERTPFAAASFDVVFCDHGAMSFADPAVTIPEVARIIRPGGILAFSTGHPLHAASWDDVADAPSRTLHHPYFDLGRTEDPADGGINYFAPLSTYVTLLIASGFTIEKMLEPRPPADAATTFDRFAPRAWARDYPAEVMFRASSSSNARSTRL
jgi:SAM-dependent methyltransferase